jgi:hypothetical protein
MSRRHTRINQQQLEIDVAQNAHNNDHVVILFYALAAFTAAGVFYFWYYFWGSPWGAF